METNKSEMTEISMDSTLDDIDDLPAFAVFPSGAYAVTLADGMAKKQINEHQAVEVPMTLNEVLELTEPLGENEEPPKVGDVCTVSYMLDNKYGVGFLKEFLKPIAERLGTRVIQELCDQSKGLSLMVVIKRTYNKEKDRFNANIKKVEVL